MRNNQKTAKTKGEIETAVDSIILACIQVSGLSLDFPNLVWFKSWLKEKITGYVNHAVYEQAEYSSRPIISLDELAMLIDKRIEAKKKKDYVMADLIRWFLEKDGFEIREFEENEAHIYNDGDLKAVLQLTEQAGGLHFIKLVSNWSDTKKHE